jgi:uncharacterized protein (TIGR03435 family)
MKMKLTCGVILGVTLLANALKMEAQYLPFMGDAQPAVAGADAKFPRFDVAVIRPSKDSAGAMIGAAPDGFVCENTNLLDLIGNAYGIKQDQILGGPSWLRDKKFDIHAKVSDDDIHLLSTLTLSQRRYMLQPLLADRFGLKVHVDSKILPVYELDVAKGGSKLKEVPAVAAPDTDNGAPVDISKRPGSSTSRPGMLIGNGITIGSLINQLSAYTHRPIVDKTGLLGKYDINLKWTPDEQLAAQRNEGADNGSDAAFSPSFFTAIQEQLGLRFVPSKGPVMVLVVDHADLPTDN